MASVIIPRKPIAKKREPAIVERSTDEGDFIAPTSNVTPNEKQPIAKRTPLLLIWFYSLSGFLSQFSDL